VNIRSISLLIFTGNAYCFELDELATTQRLLDPVKLFLDRVRISPRSPIPIIAAVICSTKRKATMTLKPSVLALTATRSLHAPNRWITARSAAITSEVVRYGDDRRED
jgi:hypothetical protein